MRRDKPKKSPPAPFRKVDTFGCPSQTFDLDQALFVEELGFHRKKSAGPYRQRAFTPPQDRGLVVGVSLTNGHRRALQVNGLRETKLFDRGDIFIRDFDRFYTAEFDGNFDFCLIQLPSNFFDQSVRFSEGVKATDLVRLQAENDPVLLGLCTAMLPALAGASGVQERYLEHVSSAFCIHLLNRYANRNAHALRTQPSLPPAAIRSAQEMLLAEGDERYTIGAIAESVGLSRSSFFTAFRNATGFTPYQWQLHRRIDQARHLLRTTNLPLAEIALQCGFADQSHFSRVFARIEGKSPGRWQAHFR